MKGLNGQIDDKQREIILSWHNLAKETPNSYMRFISEWIAFNAICYALYYKKALKIPAEIVRDKKYEKIIVDSESGVPLPAEEAFLLREENNSRISIKFFKEHNQILELKIGDKKYLEKMIFDQFASNYHAWYESNDCLNEHFDELKNSLKKEDGFYYVIKMANIDDYKEFLKSEDYTEQDLEKSKTVVFCKENKLGIVKDVLYQIRCNIFHGEKIPGEPNDDRIVQAAFPLLNAIVEFLISNLKIEEDK
jgi:hypothetical protein